MTSGVDDDVIGWGGAVAVPSAKRRPPEVPQFRSRAMCTVKGRCATGSSRPNSVTRCMQAISAAMREDAVILRRDFYSTANNLRWRRPGAIICDEKDINTVVMFCLRKYCKPEMK